MEEATLKHELEKIWIVLRKLQDRIEKELGLEKQ